MYESSRVEDPQDANFIATQTIGGAVRSAEDFPDFPAFFVRNYSTGLRKVDESLNHGGEADHDPCGGVGAIFGDEVVNRAEILKGFFQSTLLEPRLNLLKDLFVRDEATRFFICEPFFDCL
jgi:hypothetical protein